MAITELTSTPPIVNSDGDLAVDAHMQKVRERHARLSKPGGRLEAATKQLQEHRPTLDERRLLGNAVRGATRVQKIHWLRAAADRISNAVQDAGITPCKQGCNHCCHIPVALHAKEAAQIAKETGVPLKKPAQPFDANTDTVEANEKNLQDQWFGKPCPMLSESGACKIYTSRPLACRTHMTIDEDNLLCSLVPGGSIAVPYVDNTIHAAARLIALGTKNMADIRDWFDPQ